MANPAITQAGKSISKGSTTTGSVSITTTAGNTLICLIGLNTGYSVTSVLENNTAGKAFTQDYAPAAANGTLVYAYSRLNIVGGVQTVDVTVVAGGGQQFWDVVVFEVANLAATPFETACKNTVGATTTTLGPLTCAASVTNPSIQFAFAEDTGADNKWLPNSTSQTAGWSATDPAQALTAGNGFGSSHLITTSNSVTPTITMTGSGGSGTVGASSLIVSYEGVASGASFIAPAPYIVQQAVMRSSNW